MSSVEPEVVFQRQTSKSGWIGVDSCNIVCRAKSSRISDIVARRIIQNVVKEGIGIVVQCCRPRILCCKSGTVILQRIIPPSNHCDIWQRSCCAHKIAWSPVERGKIDKHELPVSGVVHRLYRLLEHGRDDLVVKRRERYVVLCRVANVIDADPEGHERFSRIDNMLQHRLSIEQELLRLIDELHAPRMM